MSQSALKKMLRRESVKELLVNDTMALLPMGNYISLWSLRADHWMSRPPSDEEELRLWSLKRAEQGT